MDVSLHEMDLPLLQAYYRDFQMDLDRFMDMAQYREYVYAPKRVEAYFERLRSDPNRVDFLVMLGEAPVGEVALKRIDRAARTCELSIHLQNDAMKNRGYGTQAERLAVAYAFDVLGMETVLADAMRKNARSQRVLEKVGFARTGEEDAFIYYQLKRDEWKEKT